MPILYTYYTYNYWAVETVGQSSLWVKSNLRITKLIDKEEALPFIVVYSCCFTCFFFRKTKRLYNIQPVERGDGGGGREAPRPGQVDQHQEPGVNQHGNYRQDCTGGSIRSLIIFSILGIYHYNPKVFLYSEDFEYIVLDWNINPNAYYM